MGTYQSHGKFIISPDGTKIWAEAAGNHEKPAVVFIHGFSLSGTVWEKQFQDTFLLENLYLLRYDLRGHGRSEQPVEPDAYTSVRMAEDFAAVCSASGVKLPYIAGWSFGGELTDLLL
ncbi:Alpha/Beta hydrolase protein [Paecilomyces variotii]|uniref:Alpha/Beta hydrolase protein n=1 Tax=Byssochlamys spectabilis TaxID=264951 RepID=A0A443HML9_BYSSP|nr:Alpha/Beta hydrolase protein [Paecilomyces variotii]RWQ93078.1 Alpha/Beta hydrolase protein [Paecilomyces variotii]